MSTWESRGKTVAELIAELRTFEDQTREARISVDGGQTSVPVSLVGAAGPRSAVLMNCEETPSVVDHWPDALPPGSEFPGSGKVYAALRDVRTTLLLQWRAPVTTSLEVTLAAGTRVRTDADTRGRPDAVHVVPVDYHSFGKVAIPWWIRWRPDYGGYTLCLPTRDLFRFFQPAE